MEGEKVAANSGHHLQTHDAEKESCRSSLVECLQEGAAAVTPLDARSVTSWPFFFMCGIVLGFLVACWFLSIFHGPVSWLGAVKTLWWDQRQWTILFDNFFMTNLSGECGKTLGAFFTFGVGISQMLVNRRVLMNHIAQPAFPHLDRLPLQ